VSSTARAVVLWLVVILSAILLWQIVRDGGAGSKQRAITFSEFMSQVNQGNVADVTVNGTEVMGKFRNDKGTFRTTAPPNYLDMYKVLQDKNVNTTVKDVQGGSWSTWLLNLAPLILLGASWVLKSAGIAVAVIVLIILASVVISSAQRKQRRPS
jgi:cell division protease FtsH